MDPVTTAVSLLLAGSIGAAVGMGELVSRYRDEPGRAARTRPAMLYMAVNALASVLALVLVWTFQVPLDPAKPDNAQLALQIITAGFGAMAVSGRPCSRSGWRIRRSASGRWRSWTRYSPRPTGAWTGRVPPSVRQAWPR